MQIVKWEGNEGRSLAGVMLAINCLLGDGNLESDREVVDHF